MHLNTYKSSDVTFQDAIEYFMPKLNCFLQELRDNNYSSTAYGNCPEQAAKQFMEEVKQGIHEIEENGGYYETNYLARKDAEIRMYSLKFKKYLAKLPPADDSSDESSKDESD